MADIGDELHIFIEMHKGIIENVRVTSDESESDIWENDWIHANGFRYMHDYLHARDNGHTDHYFVTHVTPLE